MFSKVVMIFLLLSPILQCYGWGKYDFSFIIMSLLSVVYLFTHGVSINKTTKKLLLYWGWWYLSHILSSTSVGELLHLGIIRVAITYLVFIDIMDLDFFMSKYKKISYIIIGFFYIQEFSRIVLGVHILSVATFLPLAVMEDAQEYYTILNEAVRSSSLFKEPAVFAQFLLPLLCYELFGRNKLNVKYIGLLCITLLWSRTGNAMVGLLAIGICYIIYLLKNRVGNKLSISVIIMALVIVGAATVFFKTEDGQNVIERVVTIDAESTVDKGYASSTFFRIYQGYYVFNEFSSLYKVIGNDHEQYIRESAYRSPVILGIYSDREFVAYFNSFQSVLIYTGFIGLLLMFVFIKGIWKNNSFCGKSMLFLLIAISLISSNFFTTTMALYLIPAIAMKERNENSVIKSIA